MRNACLENVHKFIHSARALRLRSLPEQTAGIIARKLYAHNWTSPDVVVPSRITLEGIVSFLSKVGIEPGATLFVHSSWSHLNNGNFTHSELIRCLLGFVGITGTLAMPAFPPYSMQKAGMTFHIRKTPTGAGLLADGFRRYPDVLRSINLNHSVCAIGPNAFFLTEDHHRSETSWDRCSPYYRLREIDDAWIIGLGVGHRLRVATSLHCVESVLWRDYQYFANLFKEEVCYTYVDNKGQTGTHCYKKRTGQIYTPKLAKYYSSDELIEEIVDGLEVYAINARVLIDKAIQLGKMGKTMYIWPIPMPWYFSKKPTNSNGGLK